jgi:DNA-binding LacI/PurR family transcriptional regulator
VCAFNDNTALAIRAGLRQLGLTAPNDLAVIGSTTHRPPNSPPRR